MTPHSEGVTCCVVLRGLMELMVVLKPDQTSSRFSIVESAEARIVLHSTLLSIHDPDTRLQSSERRKLQLSVLSVISLLLSSLLL